MADRQVSITQFEQAPMHVVHEALTAGQPVQLVDEGEPVAILLAQSDYERVEQERAFMRAVVQGLADAEAGRVVPLDQALARLGLAD